MAYCAIRLGVGWRQSRQQPNTARSLCAPFCPPKADTYNGLVRRVFVNGTITTVAGNRTPTLGADRLPGTSETLLHVRTANVQAWNYLPAVAPPTPPLLTAPLTVLSSLSGVSPVDPVTGAFCVADSGSNIVSWGSTRERERRTTHCRRTGAPCSSQWDRFHRRRVCRWLGRGLRLWSARHGGIASLSEKPRGGAGKLERRRHR